MNHASRQSIYLGISLAVLTTLIWSGNFVVARAAYKQIPPVSLAFYRWFSATLIILPFGFKKILASKAILQKNKWYLFWTALTGIGLFNTCIYVAGHYSPAINLALIGTTSSPIIAVILARIFLKEEITWIRVIGIAVCISGILYLMGKGSFRQILLLRFSVGDLWVILGAFFFAIYNVMVRMKPAGISPLVFVGTIFSAGTLLLLPFFLLEQSIMPQVQWDIHLLLIILYLGLGNSVISYLCWNAAIARLGTARTALFGNLIPVFSSVEAVFLLGEKITVIHILSGFLVIIGLIIANFKMKKA